MKEKIVLYIDDDEDDVAIMQEVFSSALHAPQLLSLLKSGEALQQITELHADGKDICLILVDLNMPDVDGRALARLIREDHRLKELPIAFISTSNGPNDRMLASELNALYFVKPYDFDGLELLAKEIIATCQQLGKD